MATQLEKWANERLEAKGSEPVRSKLILTIECEGEYADKIERKMMELASHYRGRLTRADWADSKSPGFIIRTRRQTLRRLGFYRGT